jgi:hypothetical protein
MSLYKSVTVSILKKFNPQELNDLSAFINFSVGEKNDSLKNAVEFLKSCAPDYDEKICTKENFSKKVFNKKLNDKLDKEINRLMSELKDEIEKYIVFRYAEKDNRISSMSKAQWYLSNNMFDVATKVLKSMEEDIVKTKPRDLLEFYSNYLELNILMAQLKFDRISSQKLFNLYAEFLKNKYSIDYNAVLIGIENANKLLQNNKSDTPNTEALNNVFIKDFKEEVAFFEHQLNFIKNPTYDLFKKVKKGVFNESLLLSNDDKFRSLMILNNNVHIVPYDKIDAESLDINGMKMALNKIKNNGRIHCHHFETYVIALIRNNYIKKAEQEIELNKAKINGVKDIENFIRIFQAMILEKKGEYKEALHLANNCYGEYSRLKLDILIIKLQVSYQLNDAILFESSVNNIRKFISIAAKKEFGTIYINHVLSVVSYLSKLFKIKSNDSDKLNVIKQKVISDKFLYRKTYILRKIEEKLKEKN